MSEVLMFSNVRLSFPHLVEPQRNVNATTGKERVAYNCDLIIERDDPAFITFMQTYAKMAQEKWKEHAQTVMGMIQAERKNRCYGVGEEKIKQATMLPYDGYAGKLYLSAGRSTQPQIIQPDGKPVPPDNTMAYQAMTRKMYGGCYVNVAIKPWLQENQYGRAIRADLVAIQFFKDGTPFGEGITDASDMFGAVAQTGTAVGAPTMPTAPFGVPGLPSFIS